MDGNLVGGFGVKKLAGSLSSDPVSPSLVPKSRSNTTALAPKISKSLKEIWFPLSSKSEPTVSRDKKAYFKKALLDKDRRT
ncbi:MAG: hypothetical protein ACXAB4_12935, partial [Candidatus Hodarchaeales archaeon]